MANKQIRISITSALNAAGIEATKAQVGSMAQALQKSMGDAAKSNRIHWADIKAVWDMGLGVFRKLAGGLRTAIAAAFKFETAIANFKWIDTVLGSGEKTVLDCERVPRREARRSLVLTRDMKAGEIIREEDLMPKRPGKGISPAYADIVVGRAVKMDLPEDTILTWDMV